jgi:enamine deaminase RidA (YjgF/YER057c/UK114 family)
MRQRHASGSVWEPRIGFSRAIRAGQRILVSGTAPIEPDGGCADDLEAQARRCWTTVGEALAALGGSFEDVVRTRTYLVDAADADVVGRVHGEVFGDIRPVSTMVIVTGFLDSRWRLEVEAEAVDDE